MGDAIIALISNAKTRAKPYKLNDSDGSFFYATPNGGRYWRINYRYLGTEKNADDPAA